MYNKEQYKEFNNQKYDKIKKSIYNLLKDNNFDKENLKSNFELAKVLWGKIVDDSFEEYWPSLVEYVHLIRKGIIHESGKMISKSGKNKFTVPDADESAWQLFKEYLLNKDIYTCEEVNDLEKASLKILNNLSQNTQNGEPVKGLVMGYVQSGKTNSIESLITMAADWGFNVFIVLSGIIENLRQQNLTRLRNDIDFSKNGNIHWEFIDNPNETTAQAYQLLQSEKRVVIVSLKNSKRLENIKKWLFDAGKLAMNKAKILIIDDEADQAGLNTLDVQDIERSKINALITDLVENHTSEAGAINYIGYTATPYGNFLNETGSIYPKDFIYMLPKSPKYIGATEVFGYEELSEHKVFGLDIVRTISEKDVERITDIENGEYVEIPLSLQKAIAWFICTLSYFRYKNIKKPVTMLIHKNRKTISHKSLSDAITSWLNRIDKKVLLDLCEQIYLEETSRFTKENFYEIMDRYGRNIDNYPSFEELKKYIIEIISIKVEHPQNVGDCIQYSKGLHSIIDNCAITKLLDETEQPRLIYPTEANGVDYATGFIVTGGDTLSRGLTLEGLTTTYFCREVKTVDTLMQMGRWFGYRVNYELFPRVWLDNENLIKFEELTKVEYELRHDLEKYEVGESPIHCGPIIMATYNTRITSKSKMQSASVYESDYSGVSTQTVLFDKDKKVHEENIRITEEFISNMKFTKAYNIESNLLAEDIFYKDVLKYLRSFNFCEESSFFNNIDAFCEWIEQSEHDYLKKWNVILAGTGEISIDGRVGKVNRSKKVGYDDCDYINIGALRSTADIVSDMNPSEHAVFLNDEKNIIEIRSKYEVPQLIIYRIDGNGTVGKTAKNREAINMGIDIIGLYIFVPGRPYKNNVKAFQIKTERHKEEVEY